MDNLYHFKRELEKRHTENTVKSYLYDIQQFLDWLMQDLAYQEQKIQQAHIEKYKAFLMEERGLRETTINRKMNAIVKYNQVMIRQGDQELLNIEYIKLETKTDSLEILTLEELTQLRKVFYRIGDAKDTALFELMIGTGMKVSQLVDLRIDDIKIYQTPQGHRLIITLEADSLKERQLTLGELAEEALIRYMKERPLSESSKVFLGQRGPISRSYVNKMLLKYGQLAGVDNINPNMIRKTCAHELLRQGYKKEEILAILGLDNDTKCYF